MKTLLKWALLIVLSSISVSACSNVFGADDNPNDPKSNSYTGSNKAITAFSFSLPSATGTISGTNIAVTVPYGTNVTALVATFTITGQAIAVGSTAQVSGTTPNDFTNPVVYSVTGKDSSTTNYTVTVTAAPSISPKAITAFSFANPAVTGVITGNAIAITVPYTMFSVKLISRNSPRSLPGKRHGEFPAFAIGNNRV